MSLTTTYFQPEAPNEPDHLESSLVEVRKGLFRVVQGYLLCIASAMGMGGLFGYIVWLVGYSHASNKAMEEASTIIFAGVLILGLFGLFSLYWIVRGKWLCLMCAPERFNAKWLMFASILCILVGPALSVGSMFVGERKQAVHRNSKHASALMIRELDDYKRNMLTLDTSRYVELAGDFAGLLSSVFFVLFLRALALCCGHVGRAQFAVCYLLFTGLLFAAVVLFFLRPFLFLTRPELLLGLAGGWLISVLWYFVLIVSTIISISTVTGRYGSPISTPCRV